MFMFITFPESRIKIVNHSFNVYYEHKGKECVHARARTRTLVGKTRF